MNDFGLWPPFHVFIFIHNPHGAFYVLSSHKAFVKRQVMTDSILPSGSIPPKVSKLVNEPRIDFIQCELLLGSV